jgi:hypothetical protein
MDLQYYKENVSIIRLVEAMGYSYNQRKGRHPKQYEHPNGDKVIINDKLYPKVEVYFTRNNYEDKGTVVDFVKNRLPMFNVRYQNEWEGVLKVLSEFDGKPIEKVKTKPLPEPPTKTFKENNFEIRKATIRDLGYLQFERQISKETLETFLSYIQTVREKGKQYRNIGFPYTIPGKEGTAGFELVNHGFKGHAPGSRRREAVWFARLATSPQLVQHLYFSESAIDAISFYQLYKDKYNFTQSAFISTGGNVLKNQVRNVLSAYPQAKVHTLFDNDFSGKMYDIYLAVIKANKEVSIRKNKDTVQFEMKKGTFEIPMEQLSLARFERLTGIRSGVRPNKARGKDFNEMLQSRQEAQRSTKSSLKR